MSEGRQLGPEGLEDEELGEGVGEVLLGADDVGDLHLDVVDGAGEVVEWRAVGPDDDEVADLVGGELDVSLDQVVEHQHPTGRDLETEGEGAPLGLESSGLYRGNGLTAEAVGSLLALGGSFVGRAFRFGAIVLVDVTGLDQSLGRPAVDFGSLRLIVGPVRATDLRTLIPIDADPAEPVEDPLDGVLDVPLLVGVVDPQDELAAAVVSRQQPVEQGRPDPADVQEPRRAGREASA